MFQLTSKDTKSTAAVLALLSLAANGHLIMKTPTPYSAGSIDNSPLGSANFPCKVTSDPASFYDRKDVTEMALGAKQSLTFTGSAVHGGGSCQLAITDDLQPSVSTSWKVIQSIEGGCPSKDGQGRSEYEFTIPDSIKPGDYSFAWTWISKFAGQPEYYMNCAPIKITGGSAKRSEHNETMELVARDGDMPELFVANLPDINSCKTVPGTDPLFPNPGPDEQKYAKTPNYAQPNRYGAGCVPKGAPDEGSPTGGSSSAAPAATSAAATPGGNDGQYTGEGSQTTSAAAPGGAALRSAAAGDHSGFVTVTSTTVTVPPPAQTPAAVVSAARSSAAGSSAAASSESTPAQTSSPASGGSSSFSSSGGQSGACIEEGVFNCDGSSFQQCASGRWTGMKPLPEGTKCQAGQSTSLWARDDKAEVKVLRHRR